MNAPARQATALSKRSQRRTALGILLLIGLFVMHGLPVLMALACLPDGPPRPAHQVAQLAVAKRAAMAGSLAAVASQTVTVKSADCADCVAADESCVPLRLSSSTELRAALLLGLATVLIPWAAITASVNKLVSRRGGTARTGPSLLLQACVSRT
jgi:hypothetical protein